MKSRTQLTPFARFFLFLVIMLPLAYVGAAYYNGEDPLAKAKNIISGTNENVSKSTKKTYDPQAEIKSLKKENKALKEKIEELEQSLKDTQTSTEGRQKWGN